MVYKPKPNMILIIVEGGVVQDVTGLPDGWDYDIADYDNCSDCGGLDPDCECGGPMWGWRKCPKCGVDTDPDIYTEHYLGCNGNPYGSVCADCGQALGADDVTCPKCGRDLTGQSQG